MNIPAVHIAALQALGYTEEEARFLYLVATHSGYFVARQFLAFTGAQWGKRTTLFWNKLQTKKHARTRPMAKHGAVYHLFARKVYRRIGRENLRNRRQHEIEYILARIAMLDFVLGNPNLCYLETEPDKVAYFCEEGKAATHHLPSKTYQGHRTVQPTIRYFVDRFPMFLPQMNSSRRVVTFTYIQGLETNLAGFIHHLQLYLPLFRQLREFRFLYLARSAAHFVKAREIFDSLVTIPLESNPAEDLLRYFAIRKGWDLQQYAGLTEADLVFRNLAKQRFTGDRFEHFYRAWKAGRFDESEIRVHLSGSPTPHHVQFETQILMPFTESGEAEGVAG